MLYEEARPWNHAIFHLNLIPFPLKQILSFFDFPCARYQKDLAKSNKSSNCKKKRDTVLFSSLQSTLMQCRLDR
jgi:hypothetical protein